MARAVSTGEVAKAFVDLNDGETSSLAQGFFFFLQILFHENMPQADAACPRGHRVPQCLPGHSTA